MVTRSALLRSRSAVATVFVINGALFASWTAHIPAVKARIGADDGDLGMALVGAPVGSVAAILASAFLIRRFGSARVLRTALVGYTVTGLLVGQARSLVELAGALALWGAFLGLLDIAMNTQAVAVEQLLDRQIMTGLHGSWSIGAFAGAGLGALGVAAGLSLTGQLLILGTIGLVVGLVAATCLVPDPVPRSRVDQGPRVRRLDRAVIVLGVIAAASMLCEGAAADWSAVYLRGSTHASAGAAGLGYAAFALAMVAIRFGGGRLLARFPTDRLLPTLAAAAVVGVGLALLVGEFVVAVLGFAMLGAGLGLVVPAVFSACGRLPGVNPGTAIATASGFGWVGFVAGPPVIGQLAGAVTLPVALGLVPLLLAGVAVGVWRNRAMAVGR